jgi:hypothetical protein
MLWRQETQRQTEEEKTNRKSRTHFPHHVTWFGCFPGSGSRHTPCTPLSRWERAGVREPHRPIMPDMGAAFSAHRH